MWRHTSRRVAIAMVVIGLLAGCKKDKPTEPPDDEPDPTEDVRSVR